MDARRLIARRAPGLARLFVMLAMRGMCWIAAPVTSALNLVVRSASMRPVRVLVAFAMMEDFGMGSCVQAVILIVQLARLQTKIARHVPLENF